MEFDPQRLSRFAPLGLPLAVVVALGGCCWSSRRSATTRAWRRRLTISASNSRPCVPRPRIRYRRSRRTTRSRASNSDAAALDPTSELLEQLARLAATARVANLLIETGERVTVGWTHSVRSAGRRRQCGRSAIRAVHHAARVLTGHDVVRCGIPARR